MPVNRKKKLSDLLIGRGTTQSDLPNTPNSLDVPLGKAPTNVSPDMHSWWEGVAKQNQIKQKKTKKRSGYFAGGNTL